MSIELRDLWTRPDLFNAFKLTFATVGERGRQADILINALRELPSQVAALEFFDDAGANDLVILFTHNYNNRSATVNEGLVLAILIEVGALSTIGSEGTSENLDEKVRPFREFTNAESIRQSADFLLRQGKIGTCVYAAMITRAPLRLFGIEEQELYERAVDGMVSRNTRKYTDAISKRPPIMGNNLLLRMRENNAAIAGATVTEYNYRELRKLMANRAVSCAGVRSLADDGPSDGEAPENLAWFLERQPSVKRPKSSVTHSSSDPFPTINERLDEDRRPQSPLSRLVDDGNYELLNRTEPIEFGKKQSFGVFSRRFWTSLFRANATLDFGAAVRASNRGMVVRERHDQFWVQNGGPALNEIVRPAMRDWEMTALARFSAQPLPGATWRFLFFSDREAMARYGRPFRVADEPLLCLPLLRGLRVVFHWSQFRWDFSAKPALAAAVALNACATAGIPEWLAFGTAAALRLQVEGEWVAPHANYRLLRYALEEKRLLTGSELFRLRWDAVARKYADGEKDFGLIVGLQAASILEYLAVTFSDAAARFLAGVRMARNAELWFEDCFLMRAGKAVDRWCLWWKDQSVESKPTEVSSTRASNQLRGWFNLVLEELKDVRLNEAWRLFCLRELAFAGWLDPVEELKHICEKEENQRVHNEIDRTVKILERRWM